jgi:hypothetical protein
VARGAGREFEEPFDFWGECGQTAVRKVNWLLKHAGVARLVLFKIINNTSALVENLRAAVDARYREPERLVLVNFACDITTLVRERRIERVPESWYTRTVV